MITKTAVVHAAAWKEMFDAYLARAPTFERPDAPVRPARGLRPVTSTANRATTASDRSWRRAAIALPDGDPSDAPEAETVCGLGNRKNDLVSELIERDGVEAYPGSVKYLDAAKAAGMRIAVVSSSANCRAILEILRAARRL